MADQVTGKIEPSVLGGQDIYQFTLDGMATSAQMDRLIELTKDLVKKTVGEGADSLKGLSRAAQTAEKSIDSLADATEDLADAQKKNTQELNESSHFLRNIWTRNFSLALDSSDKALSLFTGALGFAYTGLSNYGKSLTEGLKRGVAGNTFDLAIAAKSAGVSLTTFTKALGESGGGFASLGDNATDGALQFGYLVKSVRSATASVGNLGLSNDELAMLTAQQTKIAISQGFKGRQAQEAVVNNTRILGKELDQLASRTGKTTLEMAQAAAKLAQDPIVASFVKTARAGSKEVSAAIQTFAASMKGMFGEEGEKIANDALKTALSGLPFVITQSGKNMALASMSMYTEFEKLSQKAARGEKMSEEDRQRIRDLALKEVQQRGDQLRQFAMLGGPVGDSANQLLKLAQEAEFYNSEEGKRQRRQSDAAKRFNTELNTLQASLQEALIPVLQALNLIDWATIFKVVSYIPMKIAEFIQNFRDFIKEFPVLGDAITFLGEVFGKVFGAGLGLITVIGLVATGFTIFNKTVGAIQTVFGSLNKELGVQNTKYGVVGKALDVFAQAIKRATAAAAVRFSGKTPMPDMPDSLKPNRRTGTAGPSGRAAATATVAATVAATLAELEGSTRIGGAPDDSRPGKDKKPAAATFEKTITQRAQDLRKTDPSLTPADALKKAKEDAVKEQERRAEAARQAKEDYRRKSIEQKSAQRNAEIDKLYKEAEERLDKTAKPLPTVGDTFGLNQRAREQKKQTAEELARSKEEAKLRQKEIDARAADLRKTKGLSVDDALKEATAAQERKEFAARERTKQEIQNRAAEIRKEHPKLSREESFRYAAEQQERKKQRYQEQTDRERARQDRLRQDRKQRYDEIRKKNKDISPAEAMRQASAAQAKREAMLDPFRNRYEQARSATISAADKARGMADSVMMSTAGARDKVKGTWNKAKPGLASAGEKMMSPKGIGIGMAAGIGVDIMKDVAVAGGHEETAKALDVAGSALSMAGTGAMIGTMIGGPVGTAVGAALGGVAGGLVSVWKNYLSEDSASVAKTMEEQQLSAAEKREKENRDALDANRKMIEELKAIREEAGYGNQISARGVSYQASTERKIADLRFNNN
jgi:hypothetical protein